MHLINEKYDVRKFLKFSKLQVQSQSQLFLFLPDRNARAMSCPLVDMGIGRGNMEANNISSSGSLLVPASDANTTQDGDCAIKRTRRSIAAIAARGFWAYPIPSVQRSGYTPVWVKERAGRVAPTQSTAGTPAASARSRSRIARHERQLTRRVPVQPLAVAECLTASAAFNGAILIAKVHSNATSSCPADHRNRLPLGNRE